MEAAYYGEVVSEMGLIMKGVIKKCSAVIKKYPIYFGVLFLTLLIREFYPFSRYPMYDSFPNWSYTFYFEDEAGNNLKKILPISHGAFSHLYFTECHNKCVPCGYGQETPAELELIGEKTTKQTFDLATLKEKGISEISLFRIHNYMKKGRIISDTTKIATTHVE